jgi:acetyl-CoA synthetase
MKRHGTGIMTGQKMPSSDTWWQTETGGIMISPIAFVTRQNQLMQPPLPGISRING